MKRIPPVSAAAAAAALALTLGTAAAARAQAPAPKANPLPLDPAGRLTLTLDGWTRAEDRDHADFRAGDSNNPHSDLTRLRAGLRYALQKDRGPSVFLQPMLAYRHTLHAAAGNGTTQRVEMHQAFADLGAAGNRWRLGRQEMDYGDVRLIGSAAWLPEGRSFDAVRWMGAPSKSSTLDLFAGKLGHAPNKAANPTFAGAYGTLAFDAKKARTTDLYLLYKADRQNNDSTGVWTLGARPRAQLAPNLEAVLEGAAQWGDGSKARPVGAWAYAGTLTYSIPGAPLGLKLHLGHDAASGGDPDDAGRVRTFDNLFPTNHFHYGTADLVGWRNMQDTRLGLRAKPAKDWGVLLEGHLFRLQNARDFWYGDNGQPVKGADGKGLRSADGSAGRDLGSEIDLFVTYAPKGRASFAAGYSRFMPGSFVKGVRGGQADASNWLYLQSNLAL